MNNGWRRRKNQLSYPFWWAVIWLLGSCNLWLQQCKFWAITLELFEFLWYNNCNKRSVLNDFKLSLGWWILIWPHLWPSTASDCTDTVWRNVRKGFLFRHKSTKKHEKALILQAFLHSGPRGRTFKSLVWFELFSFVKMWHDLKKAVVNDDLNGRQSRDDQGASSAATKSCHSNKNRLTTPLTTYGKRCFRNLL